MGAVWLLILAQGFAAQFLWEVPSNITNYCKSAEWEAPKVLPVLRYSVVVPFQMADFELKNDGDPQRLNLCNMAVADCSLEDCGSRNSNLDSLRPKEKLLLIHGGTAHDYLSDFNFVQSARMDPQTAKSDFFYVSRVTGKIYSMKVEGVFPVAFHKGVVVSPEEGQELNTPATYYFFGGIAPDTPPKLSTKYLFKVELPSAPLTYLPKTAKVEAVGTINPDLDGLIGHCVAYNSERKILLGFGGQIVNATYSGEFLNQLLIFNMTSKVWKKLDLTSSQAAAPPPRGFASCYSAGGELVVFGGVVRMPGTGELLIDPTRYFLNLDTLVWSKSPIPVLMFEHQLSFTPAKYLSFVDQYKGVLGFSAVRKVLKAESILRSSSAQAAAFGVCGSEFCGFIQDSSRFSLYVDQNPNLLSCSARYPAFEFEIQLPLRQPCSGNGKCVNGTCVCSPDFSGPICNLRQCPRNCGNVNSPTTEFNPNICVATIPESFCICSLAMQLGDFDCSKIFCMNDCSGHGTCDYATGICICQSPYSGMDCSIFELPWEF